MRPAGLPAIAAIALCAGGAAAQFDHRSPNFLTLVPEASTACLDLAALAVLGAFAWQQPRVFPSKERPWIEAERSALPSR